MEKVRIDDIDRRIDVSTLQRPLTDALGASDLALNYYELAPGDSPAYGYHKHEAQEEVFVIQQGEMTFETETGEVVVEAGEALRFGPGE
ncbi:MAG: putative cupin superfamily protein, partial [Natronomonas sp.]